MRGLEENQEIRSSDEKEQQLRLRKRKRKTRNHNMGSRHRPHPRYDFNFLRVPEEIMLNILSRLPVESVLKSRLVCKTWSKISILHDNNTYFADMHLRRQQNLDDDDHHNHSNSAATNKMSLVFLGCSPHRPIYYVEFDKDIDDLSFKKPVVTRINLHFPLEICSLVGSCNGLICFSVRYKMGNSIVVAEDPVYICNPITREYVNLPKCGNNKTVESVHGFGYNPFTNEYKVVRIYYYQNKRATIGQVQVYTLGSGSGWRNRGEITYLLNRHFKGTKSVLLNGALHWLADGDKIVAFDLTDEEFHLLPTPPFSYPDWCEDSMLWLLEGRLCLVHQESIFSSKYSADIWLLKKNELKETWSWSKEFSVDATVIKMSFKYQPLAITKRGGISLLYCARTIVHYDPKTAILKDLVNIDNLSFGGEALLHFHSFVSLKALGENSLRAIGEQVIASAGELYGDTKGPKRRRSIKKKRSIKR